MARSRSPSDEKRAPWCSRRKPPAGCLRSRLRKLPEATAKRLGAVCITHRHRIRGFDPAENPLPQAVSKLNGALVQCTWRGCKSQKLPIQSEPMSTKSGCHSDSPRRYRRPSWPDTASAFSLAIRLGRTLESCSLLWRSLWYAPRPPHLLQVMAAFLWPSPMHRASLSPVVFHQHRPAMRRCGVSSLFHPER